MAKRRLVNPQGSFLGNDKPKRVEFIASDKTMRIDGRTYRMMRQTDMRKNKGHWSKDIFVAVDEREHRKRIAKIATFMSEHIDTKDLLQEVMLNTPISVIEKIERRIASHGKVRVVKGCYALKIGDVEIQLVD